MSKKQFDIAMLTFHPSRIGSILSVDKEPDNEMPFLLRLLNQRKYPASQLYLLMTLGPMIALVPYAEKVKGWLANVLVIFGRVPMFYYLLHIPLIHIQCFNYNLFVRRLG